MIEFTASNTNPATLKGYCDRLIGQVVSVPTAPRASTIALEVPAVCCDCFEVFGNGTGVQNDKSSFLFDRGVDSGSITLKLRKNDADVATLNSNTLGSFYDFGTWTTYAGQSNYIGFVIDWDLVLTAHGSGTYVVRAEHDILGSQWNIDSECFQLRVYNDLYADESTVFEWTQNARIVNSPINYTGMNWVQYIRVKGILSEWQPELTTDEVIYSNYNRVQVQDEIVNSYTFESKLVESSVTKPLALDMMLAGEIKITDFNLYNHRKDYIELIARQSEIEGIEQIPNTTKAIIRLKFVDKYKNTIKRGM